MNNRVRTTLLEWRSLTYCSDGIWPIKGRARGLSFRGGAVSGWKGRKGPKDAKGGADGSSWQRWISPGFPLVPTSYRILGIFF
jgi:hypothetical protein